MNERVGEPMSAPTQYKALDQRVVIVTGAARGIGRVIADESKAAGATVVRADVDAEALADQPDAVVADLATGEGAHAVIDAAVSQYGRVDVLINNAAAYRTGPLHETDTSDWSFTIDHVLTPVYACSHAVLPGMLSQGSGAIVNVASVNHRIGAPHHPAYAAAKGAIVSLTRQLAVEYGPSGVRVNSVSPGTVLTERITTETGTDAYPLRRFGRGEEVAAAVVFLASDAAGFITGVDLPVDGGLTALSPAVPITPHLREMWS